jgi:hypothetical protein
MSFLSILRSPIRKHSTRAFATLLGGAALAVGACADAPAGPSAVSTPRLELVSPAAYADGLLRNKANDVPITTEFRVTKQGGKYHLPGGLHIEVSPGTFKETTTLTATMLPGNVVAYDFQPHGLVFSKPLLVSQDLKQTNWQGKDVSKFGVGYFADAADLNLLTKQALVREFLRSTIDLQGQRASFKIFHFSGYMMSTGLVDRATEEAEVSSAW